MQGISIVENFLSEEEEEVLLASLSQSSLIIPPKGRVVGRWGTEVPYKSEIISNEIPEMFNFLTERLIQRNFLEEIPKNLTLNQYFPGDDIDFHIDKGKSGPIITIISLLNSCEMVFRRNLLVEKYNFQARALIQLRDEARWDWEHSISPVISKRLSLVYR